MSLIKVENIEFYSSKILIKIPDKIKTSGINKPQPILCLPFYEQNCKVCAASALVSYIERTKNLRGDTKNLFISFIKPYKSVSSQTLSHWIVDTLSEAGLNTNVYTAHSTRHASTSSAKRMGISINLIKQTAGWTKNSVAFAKFYDRNVVESVDQNSFANAIYNSSNGKKAI